jgi:hypothetical protein
VFRALQVKLTCPARPGQGRAGYASSRAGQGKVMKIFKGQVAGYECPNLSTCRKFWTLYIIDIYIKLYRKEKNRRKLK